MSLSSLLMLCSNPVDACCFLQECGHADRRRVGDAASALATAAVGHWYAAHPLQSAALASGEFVAVFRQSKLGIDWGSRTGRHVHDHS